MSEHSMYDYAERQAKALERVAHAAEYLATLLGHLHKNPQAFKPYDPPQQPSERYVGPIGNDLNRRVAT